MFYETFFAEEREAGNWIQVNEWGKPIYYNPDQTFRYLACRNNPGYGAFVRRLLRLGVQDLKLDLIHFDQIEWWPEPRSCRCEFCREQFRAFLRARYSDAQLRMRFGFTRLDDVTPPAWDLWAPPVRLPELHNPLMQEWARFRAASLAQRYAEYDAYIHQLNPQVALEGNPNLNFGLNKGFTQGVDVSQLLKHGDLLVTTEDSSLLTDWRLRRGRFGLADLFGRNLPAAPQEANRPVERVCGKGRVVYIPRVEAITTPPPAVMNYAFGNEHWKLPANYRDLVAAVRWAAGNQLSATVDAPLSVTLELAEQKTTGHRLLHLVNYDIANPVSNIPISVRLPEGRRLREAVLVTPDEGDPQTLKPSVRDGVATFRVPRLKVYDLILLRMEK
jgi:hypothetical protein